MYTAKIDPLDGSLVWASTTNWTGQDDIGHEITIGTDGYLYVVGVTDDGQCTGQNERCHRTYKIDPSNGDLVWYTTVNPSTSGSSESADAITSDSAGNIYVSGGADDDACGGGGTDSCIYTYKLDPADGSIVWTTTSDPTDGDNKPWAITADNNGDVYVTGYQQEGTSNVCNVDTWCIYTVKLDGETGNTLWASTTDLSGSNEGFDIVTDQSGYVYITGLADGDGCPVFGGSDRCIYTFKMDPTNGDMLWATTTDPSDTDDYSNGIAVGPNGYLYVTGYASSSPCGDGTRGTCIYTFKVDPSNGDMLWATATDPTSLNDFGNDIEVDQKTGYVYVTGSSGVDDPDAGDIYTFKLDPTDGSFVDTDSANAVASLGQVTSGKIGQGVEFDGVDDMILIGEDPMGDLGDEFTLAAWVMREDDDVQVIMQDYDSGVCGDMQWQLSSTVGFPRFSDGSQTVEDDDGTTKGEWYHLVMVSDTSETRMYMNGVQTFTGADRDWGNACTQNVYIGAAHLDNQYYFNGKMDDIRVYDRVLTASEINRLYDLGATTKVGKTLDSNPDLKDGLVGHWTFDGEDVTTNLVVDSSGYANHGGFSGDATTTFLVSGKIGQSIELDGSDEFVKVPDSASLDLTDDRFTFAAWIYPHTFGHIGQGRIIDHCGGSGTAGNGWTFQLAESVFGITNGLAFQGTYDGNNDLMSEDNIISISTWQHVALSYDGSNFIYYVDGETAGVRATTTLDIGDESCPIRIGIRADDTHRDFDGRIDDVRVYERGLSGAEIKRLYQLGATTKVGKTIDTNPDLERGLIAHFPFDGEYIDTSSTTGEVVNKVDPNSSLDMHLFNNSVTEHFGPGKIGQALRMDSTDANAVLRDTDPDIYESAPMTFSLWVKFNKLSSEIGDWQRIFGKTHDSNPFDSYLFYVTQGDDKPIWRVRPTSGGSDATTFADSPIEKNKWYHYVAIVDENYDTRLYVNNVLQVDQDSPGSMYDSNWDFNLGSTNVQDAVDGLIDDFRIYNRVLSSEEITRLYQLGQ
jgi:hypothetical protein